MTEAGQGALMRDGPVIVEKTRGSCDVTLTARPISCERAIPFLIAKGLEVCQK